MDEKVKKTIDQKTTLWNNKLLISAFVVLILGTNAFNAHIPQPVTNTPQLSQDVEATYNRLTNSTTYLNYQSTIT